jgi:hypothetical protein
MKRYLAFGVLGLFAFASAACGGSGSQGPQGEPGEAGPPGPPGEAGAPGPGLDGGGLQQSISAIIPDHAFLARNGEVTISGYATNWSSASPPTVDFGTNIKVTKTTVASPTSLIVDFTTDKTAATGRRDVNLTDTAGKTTYAKAFNVISPVAVTFQGAVAQGALALATIQVVDTSTPLDTTCAPDPLGNCTYPNLALTGSAGISGQGFFGGTVSAFSAQAVVSIDVMAKAAAGDLDLVSGPPMGTANVDFPAPGSVTVTARKATALTSGTASTGNTANAYDSALFSFTPGAATTIVDFSATSTAASGNPAIALLPSSGSFATFLGFGPRQTQVATAASPFYAIYWDNSGSTGSFSMTATGTAAAATATASANDGTKATAAVAKALPFVLTSGNLATAAGQDWVQITATANQSIRVQTVGDLVTDALVTIYQSDGTTVVGGMPFETGGPVDTGPVSLSAAGNYYVVFSQGTVFDKTHATYTAIIR